MPTGLQTPASTPSPRPPEVRAQATPPATRSGPEFSSTLREKRSDLGVEAAADPAVQPDTTSVPADRTGNPDQSRRAGGEQAHEAAVQPDAAAQGGRDMAQVLPTIVPTGVGQPVSAGSETVQQSANGTGPAGAPDYVASQSTGETAAAATSLVSVAPQSANGTGPAAAPDYGAAQSTGETAPAVASLVSVAPQAVNTQGEADPLPPVQAQATPGPQRGSTQQQSTGNGADTQSGGNEGQPGANHPAIGRAVQVQAAVAVENVVGHPMLAGPPAALTASSSSEQLLPQTVTGLNAEETATTGRVIRGLATMLSQRGGNMTMRLDPPALGQLRVQMTIARGAVTAEFQPATAEAQALLDRSIATLRSALESQGLTVERLTVHAAPSSTPTRESTDDQSQQGNQSSRNHSDAGDGRSRGRGDDPSQQDTPNHRFTANFADTFAAQAAATDTDDSSDRTGAQAA